MAPEDVAGSSLFGEDGTISFELHPEAGIDALHSFFEYMARFAHPVIYDALVSLPAGLLSWELPCLGQAGRPQHGQAGAGGSPVESRVQRGLGPVCCLFSAFHPRRLRTDQGGSLLHAVQEEREQDRRAGEESDEEAAGPSSIAAAPCLSAADRHIAAAVVADQTGYSDPSEESRARVAVAAERGDGRAAVMSFLNISVPGVFPGFL